MKNKNEVYVEVRTEKQARKLKKALCIFGEKAYSDTSIREGFCIGFSYGTSEGDCFLNAGMPLKENYEWNDGIIKQKVTIKELRNILASENLKEGDVCVFKDLGGEYIDIYERMAPNFKGQFEAKEGIYKNFIRYATEEEKSLLEPNKELEEGKWYISVSDNIIYYGGYSNSYGLFRSAYKWVTSINEMFESIDAFKDAFNEGLWQEATREEVEQALIKEAKRRYKVGDRVKCLVDGIVYSVSEKKHPTGYHNDDNDYWMWDNSANRGICVLRNGKWAEVINTGKLKVEVDTAQIKEAFEKLGDAINDLTKRESPEQKVVKYAESVDWDFEKVVKDIDETDDVINYEEYELLDGEYSLGKVRNIFNKYNPHWELNKAHKEGKEIEYKSLLDGNWYSVQYYEWLSHYEYRIKPLKPNDWVMYYSGDIKKYTIITESNLDHFRKRECTRVKDAKLIELLNNNK